ncbi:MAG: hypothetical protein V4501_02015 [Pseudomonadota bacterium]
MSTLPVNASTCEDVINHINTDVQKSAATAQNKNFPWQNLSWLQKKLGNVKKTLSPENQTQYTWHCQSMPNVFLTITIDQHETIIKVNGEYSSATSAGLFSEMLTQSNDNNSINSLSNPQQAETTQPTNQNKNDLVKITTTLAGDDANLSLEQATKDFKKWFGLDVPKDKIKATATVLLSDYYQKLKLCTPGSYKYPVINNFFGMRQSDNKLQSFADLGIATIEGFKNGKCSILIGSEASADEGTCEFTQDSLNFLADKKYASGMSASFGNADDLNKFTQIMTTECVENQKKPN